MAFRTFLHQTYVSAVNSVTKPLTTSRFKEEGVLTPEEFVAAGDLLVNKCPTWTWQSGLQTKKVDYLPADKQFLITRNVCCYKRAEELIDEATTEVQTFISVETDDPSLSEWLTSSDPSNALPDEIWELTGSQDTSTTKPTTTTTPSLSPSPSPSPSNATPIDSSTKTGEGDDDDIPDMDFDVQDDDQAALGPRVSSPGNNSSLDNNKSNNNNGDNKNGTGNVIVKTRTYDISITYDKYYRTPKVWLFGYDENHQPLKPQEVFSDISEDHAKKTVTVEYHPHLNLSSAFIHPCQHAHVMKKIIDRLQANGKEARVDQYMFLFLKFLSAVIPTIEYDNTFEIDLQ